MITLPLLLMASGLTPAIPQTDPDRIALRVRVHADWRVDKGTLRGAQGVAKDLLAAAGLATSWRICTAAVPCQLEDGPIPEVVVILSSEDRPNGRPDCGLAAFGQHAAEGTVIVSVPCVAGIASSLALSRVTHSDPLLRRNGHEDLVGAVVAHELGHLLGLKHAETGVMRARLESQDVIALRRGSLGFSRQESTHMRRTAHSARNRSGDCREADTAQPPDPGRTLASCNFDYRPQRLSQRSRTAVPASAAPAASAQDAWVLESALHYFTRQAAGDIRMPFASVRPGPGSEAERGRSLAMRPLKATCAT